MVASAEPRRKRARLPEFQTYTDDGCEVAPHCVECPLPECRYAVPGGLVSIRAQAAAREMLKELRDGKSVADVARAHGCTERYVFMVKAREKHG